METVIYCKQKEKKGSSTPLFSLQSMERLPWHWPIMDYPKELCIKLENSQWSGGFVLDQLGEFAVKVPLPEAQDSSVPYYLARVEIKLEGCTFYIVISSENRTFPPYRIENMTRSTLLISQHVIHSYSSVEKN